MVTMMKMVVLLVARAATVLLVGATPTAPALGLLACHQVVVVVMAKIVMAVMVRTMVEETMRIRLLMRQTMSLICLISFESFDMRSNAVAQVLFFC